jgi:acylphosphatase
MIARHLIIHGRVQGVFYRDWTVETARGLGLTGWVRNRRDGTVEVAVQGEDEAVERFVGMAKDGPPRASVTLIDVDSGPTETFAQFKKRATAS